MSIHPVLMLALAITSQAGPKIESNTEAVIPTCQVASIENLPVPGADAGVLVRLNVKEGEAVKKGVELARVDDREAQAQLIVKQLEYEVTEQEANSDVDIRYAQEGAT